MDPTEVAVARNLINWIRNGAGHDRHAIAKLNHFVQLLVEETNSTGGRRTTCAGDVEHGVSAEVPGFSQNNFQGRLNGKPNEGQGRPTTNQRRRPTSPYRMTSTGFVPNIKSQLSQGKSRGVAVSQHSSQVKGQGLPPPPYAPQVKGHVASAPIPAHGGGGGICKTFSKGNPYQASVQPKLQRRISGTKIPQLQKSPQVQLCGKISNSQIPRSTGGHSGQVCLSENKQTKSAANKAENEPAYSLPSPEPLKKEVPKPNLPKSETEEMRPPSARPQNTEIRQTGNPFIRRIVARSRLPSFQLLTPEQPVRIHHEFKRPATDPSQREIPTPATVSPNSFVSANSTPRDFETTPRAWFVPANDVVEEKSMPVNFPKVEYSPPNTPKVTDLDSGRSGSLAKQRVLPPPPYPVSPSPNLKRYKVKEHFTW